MRQVLGKAGAAEASALRVVDAFDEAAADGTLEGLVEQAAVLTGHRVGLRDELNDRQAFAPSPAPGDRGSAIAAALARERIRGRSAALVDVGGEDHLVASVESAAGRLGSCWLQRSDPTQAYRPTDHLVVERLAITAAQNITQRRAQADAEYLADDSPLEELLAAAPTDLRLGEIARRCHLDLKSEYVAVGLSLEPAGVLSTTAFAAEVQRRLSAGSRHSARAVALLRMVAAVVPVSDDLDQVFTAVHDHYAHLGITVRIGVGDPVSLDEASVSWRQAKDAIALHTMSTTGPVLHYRALGALQLMRHISKDQLMESSLYRRVLDVLPDAKNPPSVELLEVFLDEGSLRKAAQRVFLHHTTVESRIRKIEEQLDVDLSDPKVRSELQLILKAARVVRFTTDSV